MGSGSQAYRIGVGSTQAAIEGERDRLLAERHDVSDIAQGQAARIETLVDRLQGASGQAFQEIRIAEPTTGTTKPIPWPTIVIVLIVIVVVMK